VSKSSRSVVEENTLSKQPRTDEHRQGETKKIASLNALVTLDNTDRLLEEALERSAPVVSIIIPAFNEIGTIDRIVNAIRALPVHKQIVVVDDGSTDGTRDYIANLSSISGIDVCLHDRNSGKGAAIQSGIQRAIGDVVIVQDADLEYVPSDILLVIEPIVRREADVVYGSRYLANPEQDGSAFHRFGNKVLTGLSNLASGQKLTDMETCYKAFRRELIQSINIEQKRFGFEPEITAKLARRRVQILEVPIQYKPRSWDEGKKIGVKDLINTLWCILRYRLFR
jgi:glycosyltransferase involved in cell wall biosynthesis